MSSTSPAATLFDTYPLLRGMMALGNLMQVAQVRGAVAAFRADFEAGATQIDVLANYKDLHDQLHDLQFLCYTGILREAPRFPSDELALGILMAHETTMLQIVDHVEVVAARPTVVPGDVTWVPSLRDACQLLRKAIDELDAAALKRCILLIQRLLRVYPSLINRSLISAVRSLRLDAIQRALSGVLDTLQSLDLDPAEVQWLAAGVDSMGVLGRQLIDLVTAHDQWQAVDVELRGIEADLGNDLSVLELSLPTVKAMVAQLTQDETSSWVQNLHREQTRLEEALLDRNLARVGLYFAQYQRLANERFHRVDADLKALCDKLREAGAPLDAVLRMIDSAITPRPTARTVDRGDVSRSGVSDRRLLLDELAELEQRYKALTRDIGLRDKEIARTMDLVHRQNLEDQRAEWTAERQRVANALVQIEAQLATLTST